MGRSYQARATAGAFPSYSRAEAQADLALHVLSVCGALAGGLWLLLGPGRAQDLETWLCLLVYALALLGGLLASAACSTPPARPSTR
ncbi:MAG: hypothetical protein WD341_07410 [Tistlia sp.]|uniref:hypothetical protein n=1 Tax=Tistlia sp. TaxID=3057121 RepID=UPI0034A1697E